jgi:hypothetical protein
MKHRLLDLFWLTAVACCLLGWYVDRAKQAKELERSVELMRMYKHACTQNDAIYRREAAEHDRQYRALRAMANALEFRLSANPPDDTLKTRQHD